MTADEQMRGDDGDYAVDLEDTGDDKAAQSQGSDDLEQSLREEIERLHQQVLRGRADYANLQRRSMDAAARAREDAVGDVFRQLIQVFDQFDRALEQPPEQMTLPQFMEGMRMVRLELARIGTSLDVREVRPARGEEFNPMEHQALFRQPTDELPPNTVVAVLQVGYARGSTVLRPASVSVAAEADGQSAGADSSTKGS